MDTPDFDSELFDEIKGRGGFSELHQITEFTGIRTRTDGAQQQVTVRVQDAGPGAGRLRWSVEARDLEDRLATGNPAPDLDSALRDTHWAALDAD